MWYVIVKLLLVFEINGMVILLVVGYGLNKLND